MATYTSFTKILLFFKVYKFYQLKVNIVHNLINNFRGMKDITFEETKLFKRSVGESSDIVGKEMYQFIDKGNNDTTFH